MALTDHPYNICSARVQMSSAHDTFSYRDVDSVLRLMRSFTAPESHMQISCSDLIFYDCNKSLRAA